MSLQVSESNEKYYVTIVGGNGVDNCNNLQFDMSPLFSRFKDPRQKFRVKVMTFSFGEDVSFSFDNEVSIEIPELIQNAWYMIRPNQATQASTTDSTSIQSIPIGISSNRYAYNTDSDDGGVLCRLGRSKLMTIRFRETFFNQIPTIPARYLLRLMFKPIPE